MWTNEEKNILTQLRKDARSKSQKCYNPLCSNLAIRSHIQQKKGPVSNISIDGKIVQFEDINFYFKGAFYDFKEKGINQFSDVITFGGFCNSCDTKIFKSIESNDVDYNCYSNQLLYSYRGFLSEFYKQEYNLKWYELIFRDNRLNEDVKSAFRNKNNQYKAIVSIGKKIKYLFEQDINEGIRNFKFIYFKLPKIDICTSTAFAYPQVISSVDQMNGFENTPLINNINFINLIPQRDKLNVILGCINNNLKHSLDLDKIIHKTNQDKIKLISDILIRHTETWFVSTKLYNIWKQRKLDNEILRQKHKHLPAEMKFKHLKFNMFYDIVK